MTTNVSETLIKFGKHKGSPLREIPRNYLEWAYDAQAGDPGQQTAIAAYLGKWVPPEVITKPKEPQKPAPVKTSKPPTKTKKPLDQIESNGVKVDTAVYDCSHMFDPTSPWPEEQEWDGITAPWYDQSGPIDSEFRNLFG